MHKRILTAVTLATAAFAASMSGAAAPAEAGIVCRDGFQVVQGQAIATPYCKNSQLAQVARRYGLNVSEADIRRNPAFKNQICMKVGHDIRAQGACGSASGG